MEYRRIASMDIEEESFEFALPHSDKQGRFMVNDETKIGWNGTYQKCNEHQKFSLRSSENSYEWKIRWTRVISFILSHLCALCGIYSAIFHAQWRTNLWAFLYGLISLQGVLSGVHRLWSHKSYKAKLPLQIFLALMQSACYQNSIYYWARDHRVHHKYCDTDADPHNASRGFFFAHWGWFLLRKRKEVIMGGKQIDLSDLESDPLVMFQHKHFYKLSLMLCFFIPAWVPWYFWNETLWNSWNVCSMLRGLVTGHFTSCINSFAHLWGSRPYDKNILPRENAFVAIVAQGEGWHNYHHCFPWDYKAAELGNYRMNFSTAFIDLMYLIGQAYDLKTVPEEMIERRAQRTGDGTRKSKKEIEHQESQKHLWGWGDVEMDDEEVEIILRRNNLAK